MVFVPCSTRCLKITEKVSFSIASEASYVYILMNFWKLEAYGQTVLPDRSVSIGQKLVEIAKIVLQMSKTVARNGLKNETF